MSQILVFTATYNEAKNISLLIEKIQTYLPEAYILVIDDNSPDGTFNIVKGLCEKDERIKLIHRQGKSGLGSAHKRAMRYAIDHHFDFLITMDADFSHDPKYLPTMIEGLKTHDFVIGSRYIRGGSCDYGLARTILSRTANFLTQLLLGLKLKETTTSYRGFRLKLLQKIKVDEIKSDGYSFFVESILSVTDNTDKLYEFPIHFADRQKGQSKISKKEIINGVLTLFRLAIVRFLLISNKTAKKDDRFLDIPG